MYRPFGGYTLPDGCKILGDGKTDYSWSFDFAQAVQDGGMTWTPALQAGDASVIWFQLSWRHPVTVDAVQVVQNWGTQYGGAHAKEIIFEFSDDHRVVATETIGPFPRDNARTTRELSREWHPLYSYSIVLSLSTKRRHSVITRMTRAMTRTKYVCACRAGDHRRCQGLAGHLALQIRLRGPIIEVYLGDSRAAVEGGAGQETPSPFSLHLGVHNKALTHTESLHVKHNNNLCSYALCYLVLYMQLSIM